MSSSTTALERETILPESEAAWHLLRAKDITSTEVPALFGVSPYATEFEVWHRHQNNEVVTLEPGERAKWGLRLQDSIAEGIALDNNLCVRRMNEYMRMPGLRIGSSFDFAVDADGLLEVKNVDSLQFREGWLVDGDDIEAPPHIEIQVQHQLLVSGRGWVLIGALVGGNRVKLIRRERNEKVITAIEVQTARFWQSQLDNTPPLPDFSRDTGVIAKLYGTAIDGTVFDARGNARLVELTERYRERGEEIKALETMRAEAKAEMLSIIGTAAKAVGDKFSISASIVKGGPVAYEREDYRNFRVNWRKDGGRKE